MCSWSTEVPQCSQEQGTRENHPLTWALVCVGTPWPEVGAQDGGKILENMLWRKRLIPILWVNYMLDADGLDRDLNICKVFVMGVYHYPILLLIEMLVTRHLNPTD